MLFPREREFESGRGLVEFLAPTDFAGRRAGTDICAIDHGYQRPHPLRKNGKCDQHLQSDAQCRSQHWHLRLLAMMFVLMLPLLFLIRKAKKGKAVMAH